MKEKFISLYKTLFTKGLLVLFLFISYVYSQGDLKIVDPEDQSSAPDWGEIYIADDANYIYFLFHNYKPVSSTLSNLNVIVWIDADNNPSTGDPSVNGADYRFRIYGLSNDTNGWGTKVDRIEYYHTSWNSWQNIDYKEEGGHPYDINGNQSNDGPQTLPTGRVAGVACGMLEFRFAKSWMSGSGRTPLGSVIAVDISGPDTVGSPTNRFTHTITNNQTRTVDGRIGANEWVADAVPPAAISNLTALPGTNEGEIILRWTAPGDDGMTGTASSYIVKYSTSQITNFDTQGTIYSQSWTPQPAGSSEEKVLTNFIPGTTYYFAIVAVDDSNNKGSWSTSGVNTQNYAPAQNLDPPPPSNISFYAADKKIILSWTKPSVPDINYFKVYYDTDSSNPPYNGTGATGGPSPINVGNVSSYILSGLTNGVTYYIAITCVDKTNYESSYSTVISTTPFVRPNQPPNTPSTPQGPSRGAIGGSYYFSSSATDPDNDQIRFGWDWDGDGTVDEWSPYLLSGSTDSRAHSWSSAGTYQVKVCVQDTNGATSAFSPSASIIIGTEDIFEDFEDISDVWTYYGNGASISTSQVTGVVGQAYKFDYIGGNGYWGVFKMATGVNNGDLSGYKSFKFYIKSVNQQQIRLGVVEKNASGTDDGEWWVCTITPPTNWTLFEVPWSSFTRRSDYQPNTTFRNQNTLDKDWIRAIHFIQQSASVNDSVTVDEFYLVKDVDIIPPAAISNLTALPGTNDGEIILRWTAPGDDNMTGTAKKYIVKYSLTQITDFNTQGSLYSQAWMPSVGGSLEQRIITGLTPGVTYYFAIVAEDDWGNRGTWSTAGVNTRNYAPAQNLVPPAPTGLVVVAGDREIQISWTAVNVVDLKNYKIYYDTDAATPPYTGRSAQQGDSPIVVPSTTTSFVLTQVIPFVTYYITVTAVDNTNLESAYATVVSTVPYALDWDPPDPITDLVAETGSEHGQVILRWTATGDDYKTGNIVNGKYRIAYSSYPVSDWSSGTWNDKLNKYKFEFSTSVVAQSRQTYVLEGLRGGVTFYIKIWIADEALNFSNISNTATSWAQIDITAPGKITGFLIQPVGDKVIELSWVTPSDDEYSSKPLPKGSQYKLQYSNTQLAPSYWTTYYAQITISTFGVTPGTVVKYKITGLQEKTTYYFRIWAADEVPNWSEMSDIASVYVLGDVFPPGKINDLSSTLVSPGNFKLTWTSPGDDGYDGILNGWYAIQVTDKIEDLGIRKYATVITTFGVVPMTRAEYSVSNLPTDKKHYFVMWSADEVPNWSEKSNIVDTEGNSYTDNIPPAAITDLKARLNLPWYYDEAVLTWTLTGDDDYTGDFDKCIFRIQYSTISNTLWDLSRAQEVVVFENLKAGATFSYIMPAIRREATYYYVLWIGDGKGNWSGKSNIASVYTPSFYLPPDTTAPAQITDLVAEAKDPDCVLLKWSAPGNDNWDGVLRRGSVYKIQYSTFAEVEWNIESAQIVISTRDVQPMTQVSYLVKNLYSLTTYYFRIWTVDQSTNVSLASNIAECMVVDTVAPNKVVLKSYEITEDTGVVILQILSSGDNENKGVIYEGKFYIFYSTIPVDDINNLSYTNAQVVISTTNLEANSTVYLTLEVDKEYGFDKIYYIYLWLEDEAGNVSVISDTNTIFIPLIEKIPPSKITALFIEQEDYHTLKLSWVSTGDDGTEGNIIGGRYIIKFATFTITEDNFDSISNVIYITTNTTPSSLETISFNITLFGTTYYIAIKLQDEQKNTSELSTLATIYVPYFDIVAPKIEVVSPIPQKITILGNKIITKAKFLDEREVNDYALYFRINNSSLEKAKVVYSTGSVQVKEVTFEIPQEKTTSKCEIYYYFYVSDGINYSVYPSSVSLAKVFITNITEQNNSNYNIKSIDGNSSDGDLEVNVPYGVLENNEKIVVTHLYKNTQDAAAEYIIEPKKLNLLSPVTIKLLYFDLDNNGKEDLYNIDETKLAIYYYNELNNEWEYVGGKVDTKLNVITAQVYKLGRFAIFSKVDTPVKVSQKIISKRFVTYANPTISFSPEVEEVVLYNLNGNIVFAQKKNSLSDTIVFKGTDKMGNFLESGVYILKMKFVDGKVEYDKIIVAK
jgi:hypothetical protein